MEISVVIPVYNRAEIVERTLLSVIRQSHRPIHLILVDNNSHDDSLAVLHRFKQQHEEPGFRITVKEEPRQGAAIARNAGAREASGEWLLFFDSDDVMDPDLLSSYALKAATGCFDLLVVPSSYTRRNRTIVNTPHKRNILYNQILYCDLATVRYMVRKSVFDAAGGWNETLTGWDDWELGVRILLQHPRVAIIGDAVRVHVFHHDKSITGTAFSSAHGTWEQAIDAAECAVLQSPDSCHRALRRVLAFRRVHLAAFYYREGNKQLSSTLYREAMRGISGDFLPTGLFPILFWIIRHGGRGTFPLLNLFVR